MDGRATLTQPLRITVVTPDRGITAACPHTVSHLHNVFGNLNTWLSGPHHGVEPKYRPSYLDECVFRFNRRQSPMGRVSDAAEGVLSSKSRLPSKIYTAELTGEASAVIFI